MKRNQKVNNGAGGLLAKDPSCSPFPTPMDLDSRSLRWQCGRFTLAKKVNIFKKTILFRRQSKLFALKDSTYVQRL